MNTVEKQYRVMVVDDEAIIAMDIAGMLRMRNYEVSGPYPSGDEALAAVVKNPPDCVLMDIMLSGGIDGIETAARLREITDIPIIYLTAHSDDPTLQRAKSTNPYGYVLKPINSKELFSVVELALYKHTMEIRLKESETMFRSLFELSPIALCLVAENGFAESINVRFTETLGYTMDDLNGVNEWWPRAIPDDEYRGKVRNEWNGNVQKILSGAESFISFEGQVVCRDDSIKYIICGLTALGRKCIVSFNDITERKNAQDELQKKREELETINRDLSAANEELESANEEFEAQNRELVDAHHELAENEERYRSIFNNFPDAVLVIENDYFVDANDVACTLFGFTTKGAFIGRTPVDMSPERQSDGIDSRTLAGQRMQEAHRKGKNRFQWIFKKSDNNIFYSEVVLTCYHHGGKKMLHAIVREFHGKTPVK